MPRLLAKGSHRAFSYGEATRRRRKVGRRSLTRTLGFFFAPGLRSRQSGLGRASAWSGGIPKLAAAGMRGKKRPDACSGERGNHNKTDGGGRVPPAASSEGWGGRISTGSRSVGDGGRGFACGAGKGNSRQFFRARGGSRETESLGRENLVEDVRLQPGAAAFAQRQCGRHVSPTRRAYPRDVVLRLLYFYWHTPHSTA
jgi:hypothetical protein